jgi:predicted phosphodiesterase
MSNAEPPTIASVPDLGAVPVRAAGPLTLLHLSDIHFRHRQGSAQFDLDAQLRKPLLDDIKSKPADGANYDALLITGDIAFSGKKAEYDRAKVWLEEIYTQAGALPERTYLVPGNHDVNRDMVVPGGAIWNNHAALRQTADKVMRRELLQTQLTRDPACNPLAPLEFYNEFAQGYGCRTEKDKLAWVDNFPLSLNDGSTLRLHGLNSALNSDEGDEMGGLYLAPFQTQHLNRDIGLIDLVLCHHPPHWLLDRMEIDGALKSFARIVLFGHEHNHRLQRVDNTVQLFAGAVHPAARDPDWLPTYHILRLHVDGTGGSRQLVVQVYSRELRTLEYAFVPRMSEDGKMFQERRVDLPEWRPPSPIMVAPDTTSDVCSPLKTKMTAGNHSTSSPPPTAFRELLVNFHRLSTPVRYKIATELDLLRDGDDLPPQQQWDLVFQRAREEEKLAALWKAVAAHDTAFAKRQNPFT